MNQKFTSNNIKNDEVVLNADENDYKNLIIKLKEISSTISLLETKMFR